MRSEEVLELIKKAYNESDSEPSETTIEVWEVAFAQENYILANSALLRLLAGWTAKKPPNPKQIKEEMRAAKPLVSTVSMSAEEWKEELIGRANKGFVPVFCRPTDANPSSSYRWTPLEWVYDTGKRIKLLGIVFPEYALRLNHQLQSNPVDPRQLVQELTAQL